MARRKAKAVKKAPRPRAEAKAPAKKDVFLGKTYQEYWKLAGLPFGVLVAWGVISFLASLISPILSAITVPIGLLLGLLIGLYIGWMMVKRFQGGLLQSTAAGVGVGVGYGAVSGALGMIQALIQAGPIGAGIAFVAAIIGIVIWTSLEGITALLGAFIAENF